MTTQTIDTTEVLSNIDGAVSELTALASSLPENKFNAVPYEGSWTPGQLMRHVSKSIDGLAKAMNRPGEPAERDPATRIEELKKVFLDFSHTMKSPDFIVPEPGPYDRQESIATLNDAEKQLQMSAKNNSLTEMVNGLPFGPVTKWETVHFVLYHTQRHVHQMKKMTGAIAR